MACVFKKTITKDLPKGADTFSRKGDQFARWRDTKGKTRTAWLTTGRDDSDRIVIIRVRHLEPKLQLNPTSHVGKVHA